jgi:hypothetical protein
MTVAPRKVAFLFVFLMLATMPALATPLGPVCSSCQGGVYDLTYSNLVSGLTEDTFTLSLNVNTATYTGGGLYINAVAAKPAPTLVSFLQLSAPAGTWVTQSGALNANGCSGAGSGFLCTGSTSGPGAPVSNINNSWSWQVTIAHGTLLTGAGAASFKVLFVNSDGNKVGDLVSENITMSQQKINDPGVPEPGTLLLSAAGVIGILVRRKRRHKRKF